MHLQVLLRCRSYARVRLVEGSGRLLINNREGEEYLQGNDFWLLNCRAPLIEAKVEQKYDIQAQVGQGVVQQAVESGPVN